MIKEDFRQKLIGLDIVITRFLLDNKLRDNCRFVSSYISTLLRTHNIPHYFWKGKLMIGNHEIEDYCFVSLVNSMIVFDYTIHHFLPQKKLPLHILEALKFGIIDGSECGQCYIGKQIISLPTNN